MAKLCLSIFIFAISWSAFADVQYQVVGLGESSAADTSDLCRDENAKNQNIEIAQGRADRDARRQCRRYLKVKRGVRALRVTDYVMTIACPVRGAIIHVTVQANYDCLRI